MTASSKSPARHSRRRILIAILVVILLVILLPLISLGRYHNTIAASLSRSLGHNVNIGSINLTLLPFPGLEIHNLTVDEDPAFGAEPLLIAPTVTIYPRLSTLWTLRFEIGRINLDNASVNLVRNSAGYWNFSSLLLQASRSRTAPTAQRHASSVPRFPYVEFSGARINFKQGYEKKPFSLFETDASIWLAGSNQWRIRLSAQPVRTDLDLDLEDTGILNVDGLLTRAPSLEQIPLNLQVSWTGAQLGQVSRLLFGFDSGWRGDLRLEAGITGDMENLKIHPRVHVINAHRLEFTPLNPLNIDAFCEVMYHHYAHSLDHLICLLPTGNGHLLLTGSIPNLGHPQPDLRLEINHMPVSYVVSLLSMVRRTLPTDLSASGIINGAFTWAPVLKTRGNPNTSNILTGHAVAENVAVSLANVNQSFSFPSLTFATPNWTPTPHKRVPRVLRRHGSQASSGNIILLRPTAFSAGAPTPMRVSALLSHSGFSMRFTGECSLARLQPITGDFAQLRPLQSLAPKGVAETGLTLSGPWLLPVTLEPGPASQSQLRGFVRLQHAQLAPGWLPEPINIASAIVQFGSQPVTRLSARPAAQPEHLIPPPVTSPPASSTVTWANAAISVNGIAAKGSASYPAFCDDPSGCAAEVSLDFPSLDAAALQTAIFGPNPGAFLQALLSRVESAPPSWPPFVGTIHAGTFTIGALRLTNARAAVTVRSGKLNIASFDASTLGGSAHATGSIQNTSNGPAYALNLTWTGIRLPVAASIFHEKWGSGIITGQSSLKLQGFSSLAASAAGTFRWTIRGPWSGSPSTASSPTLLKSAAARAHQRQPLRLTAIHLYPQLARWSASGTIANQSLTFTSGPATGTISFARTLNLTWTPAPSAASLAPSLHITGTIAHPLLAPKTATPRSTQPAS